MGNFVTKIIYTPGNRLHSAVIFRRDPDGAETQQTYTLSRKNAIQLTSSVYLAIKRGYGKLLPTDSGWIYITFPPRGDRRRFSRERAILNTPPFNQAGTRP